LLFIGQHYLTSRSSLNANFYSCRQHGRRSHRSWGHDPLPHF